MSRLVSHYTIFVHKRLGLGRQEISTAAVVGVAGPDGASRGPRRSCPGKHVAVNGTKVQANVSKHSAMSYGRMKREIERLRQEIDQYLKECGHR